MKIIEALKKTKDLQRKAEDIRGKIALYCADLDAETPAYGTAEKQTRQVSEWLQSHSDIIKEIEKLRILIQKTNLVTAVSVEVKDGKTVTKTIAEWIHRRKDLSRLESQAWSALTNKNLKPQNYKAEGTDEIRVTNIRKYYDQQERDKKIEDLMSEPFRIDAALEIVNATTDLVEEK
jgi:hypothetical protein